MHKETLKSISAAFLTPPSETAEAFSIDVAPEEEVTIGWETSLGKNLYSAVERAVQDLRRDKKEPNFKTFLAFHMIYRDIAAGKVKVSGDPKFLGSVGFRDDAQTYCSLTDPGEGHIFGTTRHSEWLAGSIVHHEHLERPKGIRRKEVESYRVPSIVTFSCVRLHVGHVAPMTVYIGRFPYTSVSRTFKYDFHSAVHTVSAAMTAFFAAGAAECKVSMEGLTTRQMLAHMGALSSTPRSRLQYLSAAFNTNPVDDYILDDARGSVDKHGNRSVTQLKSPVHILRRGIELAASGGFDKVTFDGASDGYPSKPLTEQVPFEELLALVHEAHSVGLTTYVSAGFKFANIKDAVFTGVDGIGLGGTQILRAGDNVTGMHGQYMHFEGSLTTDEKGLRDELFKALGRCDEGEIKKILEQSVAKLVLDLSRDGEMPYVGRAKRILRTGTQLSEMGHEQWDSFRETLKRLMDRQDDEALHEKYRDATGVWFTLRQAYRKSIGEDSKSFCGDPVIHISKS
ncbi:hypothetical protein B0H16DRAFT_1880377 [Mycena metata]|uniref:Uncharacterized protein n=1 Tax=Mycena metata TaxID=1033252 RepID=A0AAD7NSY5_9AGAR|nr:hypothetical protein B0H16DRAFT_1880377 [Mycena metata]